MKKLLLTTSFLTLLISSLFAAETRTEFITEEVCPAIAGCWVDVKTGECPDCITITKTIVTLVESKKYKKNKPKSIVKTKRRWFLPKNNLEVPKSYYQYGYPTLAGMNMLTSTFHQ